MKKLILILLFAGPVYLVFGQQAPQFTQFMQTGTIFNPALTGVNGYTEGKLGYRKQWAGLPNSPTTLFASASGQFGYNGVEEPSISLPVRGRLASKFNTEKPEALFEKTVIKHAIGGFIIADQTSPTALNIGNLSYALHLTLGSKWNLSFGAGVSLAQTSLNRDKLNVDVKDDPGIGSGLNSKINPDVNAGLFLHSKNLFLGYSAGYLLRNKIFSLSDQNTLVGKQRVHHYGTLGFRLDLNESWAVTPSAMIKFVEGAPISADFNCRIGYKEMLWFGPGFRNQDSFSGLFGFNATNQLSLSYAYDYNYSQLNASSNGSHEVILGFRFVKSGVKTPRPAMW